MERGHAEALMPLIDRVTARSRAASRPSTASPSRSARAASPGCGSASRRPARSRSPPASRRSASATLVGLPRAADRRSRRRGLVAPPSTPAWPDLLPGRRAGRAHDHRAEHHGLSRRRPPARLRPDAGHGLGGAAMLAAEARAAGRRGPDRRRSARARHRLGRPARRARRPGPGPAEAALSARARRQAAGRGADRRAR